MIEKFFIIKKDSPLYKEYWEWKEITAENQKVINKFFEQNGIAATKYWVGEKRLGIVPDSQDNDKFGSQFTKHPESNGLHWFKRNSPIGKLWEKQAKTITFKSKPNPSWYNDVCSFTMRSSSRLFDYKGVLYCSYESDAVNMPASVFEEIKGSDFYKILEEIERNYNNS